MARTQIGWRPIYVIGSRRAQVQAVLFNMRGGHNGIAVEAGFFKYPGQPDHVAAGDHRIDDLGRRRWHQPRARPLNSYMRNLRISSDRLI